MADISFHVYIYLVRKAGSKRCRYKNSVIFVNEKVAVTNGIKIPLKWIFIQHNSMAFYRLPFLVSMCRCEFMKCATLCMRVRLCAACAQSPIDEIPHAAMPFLFKQKRNISPRREVSLQVIFSNII